MDETEVVIIGAGPAGLALGLALAKFQIRVGRSSYPVVAGMSLICDQVCHTGKRTRGDVGSSRRVPDR